MTSQFYLTWFYDDIFHNSVFQLGVLTQEFNIPLFHIRKYQNLIFEILRTKLEENKIKWQWRDKLLSNNSWNTNKMSTFIMFCASIWVLGDLEHGCKNQIFINLIKLLWFCSSFFSEILHFQIINMAFT